MIAIKITIKLNVDVLINYKTADVKEVLIFQCPECIILSSD
jgi:hypothetical protein